MLVAPITVGSGDAATIVFKPPLPIRKRIVSRKGLAFASRIAWRSDPGPLFSVFVTTNVRGGTTASAVTLTVSSATGFPATAEFRVKIDSAVLIVTAGAGTTTWTVERGGDGTSPAIHNAGAVVTLTERVALASCSGGGSPCTSVVPSKTSTGADGKSYRVDTFIT